MYIIIQEAAKRKEPSGSNIKSDKVLPLILSKMLYCSALSSGRIKVDLL